MRPNILIYSRVSTSNQNTDRQIRELEDVANSKNWNIIEIISETISGTSEITSRKINDRLLELIKSNQIDKILITEISRLGRKVTGSLSFIEFLNKHQISLYIHNLGMETIMDNGKVNHMFKPILVTLASFAEMERELLSERIKSGLDNARAKGKHIGRPKGNTKAKSEYLKDYKKLINDLDKGLSLRKLSTLHNVSINTIRKVKEMTM